MFKFTDILEFKAKASENDIQKISGCFLFIMVPATSRKRLIRKWTFDNVRSQVGEVKINVPGISYGSTPQRLASNAAKLQQGDSRPEMVIMTLSLSLEIPVRELTLVLFVACIAPIVLIQ